MKTQNFRQYLINCIDIEYLEECGYSVEGGEAAELLAVKACFESEKTHAIKSIGYRKAFTEWLAGLCGAVRLPYMNHDIVDILVQYEAIKNTDSRTVDAYLSSWFEFCAHQYVRMIERADAGYKIINPKK
jgi:hypothetical protein